MDRMAEVLQALAAKLGTTVEELGPHIVRSIQIEAFVNIGSFVMLALVFAVAGALCARFVYREGVKEKWQDADTASMFVAAIVLPTLLVVIFLVVAASSISAAMEPTGATLLRLMGK